MRRNVVAGYNICKCAGSVCKLDEVYPCHQVHGDISDIDIFVDIYVL